jgi:hypothetical protein
VSVSFVFPFFRPISFGLAVDYHLGRMQHADLGNLGFLSVISPEATVEFRLTFLKLLEVYLSGGAGYFFAFRNEDTDPSRVVGVTNFVWGGRLGVGLRVSSRLTIGLQGEYRRYESLYHLFGAGFGVDIWLGGDK